MERQGLKVEVQKSIQVIYKGEVVGDYLADMIVNNKVVIELKAQKNLHPAHETQIINYLKATGIQVGLLVNFAFPKASIKRYVL